MDYFLQLRPFSFNMMVLNYWKYDWNRFKKGKYCAVCSTSLLYRLHKTMMRREHHICVIETWILMVRVLSDFQKLLQKIGFKFIDQYIGYRLLNIKSYRYRTKCSYGCIPPEYVIMQLLL